MKKILYLSAFALFTISVTACNENKKAKNYNEKSQVDDVGMAFIKKANEASLAEIKAATIAQSKSQNPRVLSFAKMMIADHTTAANELQKIADNKFVSYRDDVISMEHRQMIDSASNLSGAGFDKAYMQMMVNDHTKAVEMFRDATTNDTKAVQDYASKYLPKLKMHLDSAQAINASLK